MLSIPRDHPSPLPSLPTVYLYHPESTPDEETREALIFPLPVKQHLLG